jgi:hypothetical protein
MTTSPTITRRQVADDQRVEHTAAIFGIRFPLNLEPLVYTFAEKLSPDYDGGYWTYNVLSNGGFYMAPDSDRAFHVACDNGYEGVLSADALGIAACLYAYSHLSFSSDQEFAQVCAQQYHWLRDYMLDLPESLAILGATD